jgi:hypothetical protein
MPRVPIQLVDSATGEPIDRETLFANSPGLAEATFDRYSEFMQAMVGDDDLAFIARVCALNEMHLRLAIDAHLAKPESLKETWRSISSRIRVRLALAMDLIPDYIVPLLEAISALRNKVLHDTPQGAISERDVAKLLDVLPPENIMGVARAVTDQAFQTPLFAALQPHQRDFRFALLAAYVTCLGAAQHAARRAQQPEASAPD